MQFFLLFELLFNNLVSNLLNIWLLFGQFILKSFLKTINFPLHISVAILELLDIFKQLIVVLEHFDEVLRRQKSTEAHLTDLICGNHLVRAQNFNGLFFGKL